MAIVSIFTGMILVALGCYGFNQTTALTALIPAYMGGAMIIAGGVALVKPCALKHAMHGSAMVALIGTLAGLFMGLPKLLTEENTTLAPKMQVAMGVVCLCFMILAIRSFINVRKAKQAQLKNEG